MSGVPDSATNAIGAMADHPPAAAQNAAPLAPAEGDTLHRLLERSDIYLQEILQKSKDKPFLELHSATQVCVCDDAEALIFLVRSWADPNVDERDSASIEKIIADWTPKQLMAVSIKLGFPQFAFKEGYKKAYQHSIITRARAHAIEHPELFAAPLRVPVPPLAGAQAPQMAAHADHVAQPPAAPQPVLRRSQRVQPPAAPRLADLLPVVEEKRGPGRPRGRQARSPQDRSPASEAEGVYSRENSDESSDYEEPDEEFEGAYLPKSSRESGDLTASALRRQSAAMGDAKPIADIFLKRANRAAGGGSLYNLYKFQIIPKFPEKAEAARKECLAWARLLDCLQTGDTDGALEVACRRLGGVQIGAKTGNWRMCAELDRDVQDDSFIPHSVMSAALKAVTRDANIRKMAQDEASSHSGGGNTKGFKGKPRSNRNAAKGAGVSAKKRNYKRDESPSSGPERK